MKLNKEKIIKIKLALGLTWQEIADRGGANTRQSAYLKYKEGSALQAEYFGKVFGIKPKDLIK